MNDRIDATRDARAAVEARLGALEATAPGARRTRFYRAFHEDFDYSGFERLQRRFVDQGGEIGRSVKFLDLVYWLDSKLDIAEAYGIPDMPPGRILDLGTGNALFPVVCRHFGHEVVATDTGENAMYNALVDFFGIRRIVHRVEAFTPLALDAGRFDLVTALMVTFNKRPRWWGLNEWTFFMRDAAVNETTDTGQMLLKIGLKYYDDSFRTWVRDMGAEIEEKGGFLHFTDLSALRRLPPSAAAAG